jgi:hypothetical protein
MKRLLVLAVLAVLAAPAPAEAWKSSALRCTIG